MTWYFDIPNMLVCVLATLIACRTRIIPYWIGLILACYSAIPFFLNDFLFPARYMKDQFFYFDIMKEVRAGNFLPNHQYHGIDKSSIITSWFLSLLPIPFFETIKSMGFFNRFLFLILFLWLYNKKFLQGITLFFIIFYPSLVFYTSLSLRDPLVLFLMIVGTIYLVDKRYLPFFVVILPLYFIKFQNFFFMLLLLGIFIFFKNPPWKLNYKIKFILLSLFILVFYFYIQDIITLLNLSRYAFFIEDGNNKLLYKPLVDVYSLLIYGATSFPHFLMMPLPWQADNIFQLIQSIENIFILLFLIIFTLTAFRKDKFLTFRWILFFVIVITIHGLVVYNYGTAVRYKFIFIVMYIVGLSYELYKVHGYLFTFDFKKKITKN